MRMLDFQAAFGNLVIDGRAWEVHLDGDLIDLTKTEFEILVVLASRPRQVVTDEDLTRLIWGDGWIGDDNNLAVHVSKLRRKLGESGLRPRFIRTIRGVGYRFDPGSDDARPRSATLRAYADLLALPGAIEVRTDGELRVVSTWPDGAPVLGFAPDDLIGRHFPFIGDYPWGQPASTLDGLEVLNSSGVREWVSRYVVTHADGGLRQADFAARLDVDEGGRLRGVRFVFVDRAWPDGDDGGGGFADSRTARRSAPSVRS